VAGLLERVSAARAARRPAETRYSIDTWISDYLIPATQGGMFGYGGNTYPFGLNQTYPGKGVQEVSATLPGYMAALRTCPPAFAAQMVRALVLSGTRFVFRNPPSSRTPRRTFGTSELAVLERPWPNATTGELLSRMEWHAGPAGNAFVHRRSVPKTTLTPLGARLRVLRPDWVGIAYGSQREPEDPQHALDGELLGYVYQNGGFSSQHEPEMLLPADVAHWSPIPDPENAGIGMSWITPAVRELQADRAVTDHKLVYFRNGATPNLVVKGLPFTTGQEEAFQRLVAILEAEHAGIQNAYKTLYLSQGADATIVGSNLAELDLKNVQGASETRISVLSRVPAALLGISEGLAGSTLNAGNFGMARRIFADTWVYPTLQDVAAALAPLLRVPADAELWFDTGDIPLLREDAKDAAEITEIQARTIGGLVKEGFTADTAVSAVTGQDLTRLVHTGLVSVQLQPPGGPAGLAPEVQAARDVVEMIQKVYLGVGVVLSAEEAREILNQGGANLDGSLELPAPPPGNGQVPAATGAA
jgi:phage portal protein BeeE